ncbi:MAG: prepilin-type N-terminal cleavage/methylation domain-containing protein [Planctomycetes bacterium]|nr:prepilin-type N-terminal cleavage/methylation domain-containing protein [Planctomycetota bacterium]
MLKRMRTHRPAAGFTLVEMLIAVAIAVLILALVFTILNGASAAQASTRNRIQAAESARVFFETLERDLAGAAPRTGAASKGELIETLAPLAVSEWDAGFTGQGLHFFTARDANAPGAEFFAVRYYVCRRDTSTDKRLFRRVNMNGDLPALNFAVGSDDLLNDAVLLTGVRRLNALLVRWDPAVNAFTDASATPGLATHLEVILQLGVDSLDGRYTAQQQSDLIWTFSKTIPIPATFP